MEVGLINELAEQTYLGCLIIEPELIEESILTEEMFYFREHQVIYREMRKLASGGNPFDLHSLYISMRDNKSIDEVNERRGGSYVLNLANSIPTTASFQFYGLKVMDAYKVREVQKEISNIMSITTTEQAQEIITEKLRKADEILSTGIRKKRDLRETIVNIYDKIERGETSGISTGYTEFDRLTLGFHLTDFVVIGARPSMGKTAFILNVAMNQTEEWDEEAQDHANHLHVFSLEMAEEQLVQRMLGAFGRINAHNLRSGQLAEEDWGKLTHSMAYFSNLSNLDIYDKPATTVPEIIQEVRTAQRKYPNRKHIVMIDYLQLMGYHGKSNDTQTVKVGEISKALKQMAKTLNVCVVALSQLSRGVEQRQDKRPMMSDIRESGNIEQDADVIGFLYRDDYYDRESENKNIVDIILAKQRNGAVGTISLAFIKEYGVFLNLERRFNE